KRLPTLIDSFYGDLPPGEVSFARREVRVPFNAGARIDDASGDIVRITVPPARTLIVTGLQFYADPPDGQTRFVDGDLRSVLAFGLLFDDHSAFDLYSEIDVPTGGPDPQIVRGSFFTGVGDAIGGHGETPHLALRAREGTTVRAAYAVMRTP